ncbi:MAG TPA: hypothetical protein PLQ94_08605, partial [Anaerolineales bacterium]|nr:hypothetical protein [Anaerolineales bacterium]
MEFEQILKRLEWLDKQQRENQDTLTTLSARLASFETTVEAVSKQIKPLSKQIADIAPTAQRLEQFEKLLTRQRGEFTKLIEENQKAQVIAERENANRFKGELIEIQKSIVQVKTAADQTEVKKQIKARDGEIQRVMTNFSDLKMRVDEVVRTKDDAVHAVKAVEETRKNDLKRVADIQGEVTALRKRIDENRDKHTITADGLKNIENRFSELLASEQERKQAQKVFLEQ